MSEMLLPGLDVSRETRGQLEDLAALITRWTARINLVAPSTVPQIWERHILDSAQLVLPIDFTPKSWVDLGSGAGLPGLVIAVIATQRWPLMRTILVESDQRKSAFLRTAARELGLTVDIHAQRIDALDPQSASVVSARALAPLSDLLAHAQHHLAPDGVAVFPKGRNHQQEIDAARQTWRFELALTDSLTDHEARILRIERITRA